MQATNLFLSAHKKHTHTQKLAKQHRQQQHKQQQHAQRHSPKLLSRVHYKAHSKKLLRRCTSRSSRSTRACSAECGLSVFLLSHCMYTLSHCVCTLSQRVCSRTVARARARAGAAAAPAVAVAAVKLTLAFDASCDELRAAGGSATVYVMLFTCLSGFYCRNSS